MSFVRKQPHERNSTRRAVTPRRMSQPDYLSSFFGAAAARNAVVQDDLAIQVVLGLADELGVGPAELVED
jgi:hypothetical protein